MSNYSPTPRPGMTALAAVIALTSTTAFAQAQPDAAPAAPVTIAPPAPTVVAPATAEAAPVTVAPAAPMAATEATTANASAPVEPMKMQGTPVVHQPDAADAAPVARAAPAAKVAKVRTVAPATTVPAPTTKASARVMPTPPAPTPRAPEPAAPVTTAAVTTTSRSSVDDETLAIAGAGGVALIAIAGGAYAIARRRRRDDEVEADAPAYESTDYAVADPVVVEAPAAVAVAPSPFARPAESVRADLPEDFDTSRFGRHVQAAYAGPTPENPSMSLRRRLARARFFDQRERAGETFEVSAPIDTAIARRPAARKEGLVTSLLGRRSNTGFRPAFQG